MPDSTINSEKSFVILSEKKACMWIEHMEFILMDALAYGMWKSMEESEAEKHFRNRFWFVVSHNPKRWMNMNKSIAVSLFLSIDGVEIGFGISTQIEYTEFASQCQTSDVYLISCHSRPNDELAAISGEYLCAVHYVSCAAEHMKLWSSNTRTSYKGSWFTCRRYYCWINLKSRRTSTQLFNFHFRKYTFRKFNSIFQFSCENHYIK